MSISPSHGGAPSEVEVPYFPKKTPEWESMQCPQILCCCVYPLLQRATRREA